MRTPRLRPEGPEAERTEFMAADTNFDSLIGY
jgi:hypothetical protein